HLSLGTLEQTPKNVPRAKGPNPQGPDEMLRAAAALEHLPATEKKILGDAICERLSELRPHGGPWAWPLGRLGGRLPLYGTVHNVVPRGGISNWIGLLLELQKLDGRAFALAQLARKTGDRLRDIDELLRATVIEALRRAEASETMIQTVSEVAELKSSD